MWNIFPVLHFASIDGMLSLGVTEGLTTAADWWDLTAGHHYPYSPVPICRHLTDGAVDYWGSQCVDP